MWCYSNLRDCGEMASSDSDPRMKKANPCADGSNVIYAWALNAKPLQLPENVGFQVGKGTQIQYLVLQIHYSKKFKSRVNWLEFCYLGLVELYHHIL
ncbi:Cu2 monooxygen domain containing protein [Asbolus verrucosus]|uniref:Cu2 monooxygen domain containing protein n=1 Tax=Asbolus verrucosus TaxID=1661398 RepID=A0A482V0F1_ASBVE|nr:Cu2 monooxygen domain containing protein [Asbolus verrucosus]